MALLAAATSFWEQFMRLYNDGPEVGIYTVGCVARLGGVPAALSSATNNKPLFKLADKGDGGSGGAGGHRPAVAGGDRRRDRPLPPPPATALRGWPPCPTATSAQPCSPCSRRSTALLSIAGALLQADPKAQIFGMTSKRSPLASSPLLARCATATAEYGAMCNLVLVSSASTLVLIDDVEQLHLPEDRLSTLVAGADRRCRQRRRRADHVQPVGAGRPPVPDRVLLQPVLDRDGDLLCAQLPYKVHTAMSVGRGFLVCNNAADLVQVTM